MARKTFSSAVVAAAIACAAAVPAHAGTAPDDRLLVERYDAARARLWRLSRSGVEMSDPSGSASIELPDWQWILPPYGCLPDLALGPGGEAVITSNVAPTLWRIDPRSLAVTVHPLALDSDPDKDIGFSRIVYSAERGAYYALAGPHRSVWEIPATLADARKVPARLLRQRLFQGDRPCAAR
jgi:hypothetical protein